MQKNLMILTSHRLDCLRLCTERLVATNAFAFFDRVIFLLNGVEGVHLRYVQDFMAAHPEVNWDTVAGPRGRNERISGLENECIRRHPGGLYIKMDEDVFVSAGVFQKMLAAYETAGGDTKLALVTPVVPNNASGSFYLLNKFPALKEEYLARFNQPLTTDYNGPVWINPWIAEWLTREFLDLEAAVRRLKNAGAGELQRFAYRFSINCILFDYRHWDAMGGVPKDDEPAWTQWVVDHGAYNLLVTDAIVHHYSFFVQQDYLDRSSLLEDIRIANLPGTLTRNSPAYVLPRWVRIGRQVPGAIRRRLFKA
jgi:hypothetical protein